MQIPFSPPYIDDDVIFEVTDALKSGWITTGPKVLQLENEVAAYCNVSRALAVNSATSAMMLILHWFGVSEGDEVIIPAYTYCATALAVMHVGAKPVMVDVQEDFNIDPQKITEAITNKTKVIITVDIGGLPCDYDAIRGILNNDNVKQRFNPSGKPQLDLGRILIMSDAAHAFGAMHKDAVMGTQSDISIFSFHAVKNITTAEGGLICLNMPPPFDNIEIYHTLRIWSLNGQTKDAFTKSKAGGWKYDIIYPGFKINMPDVLAAIGLSQLKKYKNYILPERKRIMKLYTEFLQIYKWAICPVYQKEGIVSSCHLFQLRIKDISESQRDDIIEYVTQKGVAVNVHFIPLPMLTVFKDLGYEINMYPQSYLQYMNEISLPIYPQLKDEECTFICKTITEAVNVVTGYE